MALYSRLVVGFVVAVLCTSVSSLPSAGAYTNSSATITSPPIASQSSSCPQCQINLLGNDAKGAPLIRFAWWSSTLGLTLDTLSIIVTKYNNTAITVTKTVHGNVSALDTSTVSEALSIASQINVNADPEYNGGPLPFILVNGTDGNVDEGVSIAYPTPFFEITALQYSTITKIATQCPSGLSPGDPEDDQASCVCAMESNFIMNTDASYSYIDLSSAYYSVLDTSSTGEDFFSLGDATINTAGFKSWLSSDTSLLSAMPQLRSCFFQSGVNGPPAVKIPVTALTATTTATVNGVGSYTTQAAKPQNPITPMVPPQTSIYQAPNAASPTSDAYQATVPPENTDAGPDLALVPSPQATQISQNEGANVPQAIPTQVAPQNYGNEPSSPPTSEGTAPAQYQDTGSQSDNSPTAVTPTPVQYQNAGSQPGQPSASVAAAPQISYAGAVITPDTSSAYDLPRIGKLSPGGSPVTTNNVVYSLPTSATAIISNGYPVALTPIPQASNVIPSPPPALTFAGSTYTAEASNYIVGAQTLKPGAPAIVVSGTSISLASHGEAAIIGSSTQQLVTPAPTQSRAPALTFAGSTYQADSNSQFIIGSQTLTPGGIITVAGTPISLGSSASVAIVGTNTQSLLSPTTVATIITFAGSTYTANSASEFVIASQTLTQGRVLTIGGTPLSYASGGSDVVVGTSTEAVGLGALIMGALTQTSGSSAPTGSAGGAANATGVVPFTGTGSPREETLSRRLLWGVLGITGVVWWVWSIW